MIPPEARRAWEQGATSPEAARLAGCSASRLRTVAFRQGWRRDPGVRAPRGGDGLAAMTRDPVTRAGRNVALTARGLRAIGGHVSERIPDDAVVVTLPWQDPVKGTWSDPAILDDDRIDNANPVVRIATAFLHANESIDKHHYIGGTVCPYCALRATRALRAAYPADHGMPR